MKKTLLSIFSVMTLVMGMTSCNKDAKEENFGFTASMEAVTDEDGKTYIDGVNVNWENGDQVAIYGSTGCGIFTAVPHNDNLTIADLTNGTANPGEADYSSFYPVSISNSKHQFTMPAVQTTTDGQLKYFPMYAESDTKDLLYKNLLGALKIHLTSATLPAVKAIEITTPGFNINGTYTAKMYGAAPTMRLDANGTSTTRLECETALSIANGRDFFIAMPHATYTALQINVYDEDNNVIATKTLKAGKSIQIHRSQVTNINLSL